MTIFEVVS